MNSVKARFIWIAGIFAVLLFGMSAFAAIVLAFSMPESSFVVRTADVSLALVVAGVFAFGSAQCFLLSGYGEQKNLLDSMLVRLYLLGIVGFAVVYAISWLRNPK